MSKSNFAKLFKSELDISPMKKKRLLKLDKAMELLEFSDLNITEIAESLCFCDLQTFSRFFQKETGISPSSFLRHHRKK
jgi:AraC-like DNA-binding protein